mgnify:CR=1 FL=1
MKNQPVLKHYGIYLMFCFLLFNSYHSTAQQKLTIVNGWNAYVYLPSDYNLNPQTKYRTIIFIPGLGEVGTDPSLAILNGPGAYITQGWNGESLGVKFIVISLQPAWAWPGVGDVKQRIDLLKTMYRIGEVYMTGLSMGGWASLKYSYSYPNDVKALVGVESVVPVNGDEKLQQSYNDTYGPVALAGENYLIFEQVNDYRQNDMVVAGMNSAVPGSGIYIQTDFGNGGHCCWSSFYGGGGTTPTKFNIEGTSMNIYEWIAQNSIGTRSALPITMDHFTAKPDKNDVLLDWGTASESNSSYFEIQRSTDGQNFTKIGTTNAAGNSATIKQYYYRDVNPLRGINYYRLKMADLDGAYTFSKTVTVEMKNAPDFSIKSASLNGTAGKLNLDINSATNNTAQIFITDATGRVFYRHQQNIITGENFITDQVVLPVRGIYYLRISNGTDFITKALLSD